MTRYQDREPRRGIISANIGKIFAAYLTLIILLQIARKQFSFATARTTAPDAAI